MRLNRIVSEEGGQLPAAGGSAEERIEALLRQAADFDPEIRPAGDFVRLALAVRGRRRLRRAKPLVLGFSSLASGMAAAALLLFVLSRTDSGLNQGVPVVTTPEEKQVNPPAGAPIIGSKQGKPASSDPGSGKPPAAVTASGAEPIHSPDPSIGRGSHVLQTASMSTPVRRTEPSRGSSPPVPKVRWKTETVQRYDRGVIAPAYIVEEKDRNGDVVYQPVMMPVTTETGARPLLTDSVPDTSIQLTSLSEETPHK